MKILVTGGAGYIGSVVAERLLEMGETVVIFDNLGHGHRAAVPSEAEFICGDLTDRELVGRVVGEVSPDAVAPVSYTHLTLPTILLV